MKFGSITTPIITDGLVFNADPANRASYPKTGTITTDTINSITGSTSGASFETTNNGIFDFDGSDDYIGYSNPSNLNFSADNTFSFSVWFKKGSDGGTTMCAFSKAFASSAYNGYLMYISGNLVHFRIREDSSRYHQIRDDDTHPLNTWLNYTVTYDGSRTNSAGGMELYQNGVKLTNVTRTGNFTSGTGQTTANFDIGARSSSSSLYFDGNISNLQIYNRVLSSTEVLHNYNALKSRFE